MFGLLSVGVGAALAYFSVRAAEVRKERRDAAEAYGLMFALQRVIDELLQLTSTVQKISEERCTELSQGVKLWQIFPITFGWDSTIEPSNAQLSLVAALGD